jgi:hypothetical protein
MTNIFVMCSKKVAAQVCTEDMINNLYGKKKELRCYELPALYLFVLDSFIHDYVLFTIS